MQRIKFKTKSRQTRNASKDTLIPAPETMSVRIKIPIWAVTWESMSQDKIQTQCEHTN